MDVEPPVLNLLPAEDREINLFNSPEILLAGYGSGSLRIVIDRGLAMRAVSSGVPMPFSRTIIALSFPVAILAFLPVGLFFGFWWALTVLLYAILAFRLSKRNAVWAVRRAAVSNPKLLSALMRHGTVYFVRSSRSRSSATHN